MASPHDFQTVPQNCGRRAILGRSVRAVAGLGALAAIGDGVAGLLAQQGSLVGPAQGAVPANAPAPVPPRQVGCTAADRAEWETFKSRFVAPDGRVVDTGNKGISHSEGQSYGLLFAVAYDEPGLFERILGWTDRWLGRRRDALYAWRYVPGAADPVADTNNATDGDLFIACALWRASFRWGRPDYAAKARAVAGDVLRLLVREVGGRTVLLPAAVGFEKAEVVNVNPSYYSFVALQELAEAVPSPVWAKLRDDGVALITEGCFGSARLPPDWLSISRHDGALAPAAGWPARFSYDAIRVPLALAWAGLTESRLQAALVEYWRQTKSPAAWVDLRSGARADYPAPPGFVAVAKIATAPVKTALPHDFPSIRSSTDYYSAALTLLARLAWQESVAV